MHVYGELEEIAVGRQLLKGNCHIGYAAQTRGSMEPLLCWNAVVFQSSKTHHNTESGARGSESDAPRGVKFSASVNEAETHLPRPSKKKQITGIPDATSCYP